MIKLYKSKLVAVFLSILLIFALMSPAVAADKSKTFSLALLLSGIALKFASVREETRAIEAYDKYLHTAIQTEMKQHTDDYELHHNLSLTFSRTGLGFVGLAVVISVAEQLSSISAKKTDKISYVPKYDVKNGRAIFSITRSF